MDVREKTVILIPSYNPDGKLEKLIHEIISAKFSKIVVINDGSAVETEIIFDTISKLDEVKVISHSVNQGKGRALKTGFDYIKTNFPHHGTVTVDADGQHAVKDIIKTATKLQDSPESLILGVRDFSGDDIPARSRFGNNLTKVVVKLTLGISITDTQTGLRGIPYAMLGSLLSVKGERYEYEMNMILECKNQNILIEEVPIETIYIEENESSHFNPIVDSIKIYSVFLKFISSSLLSFGVDILLFTVFSMLFKDLYPVEFILIATVAARVLSSLFNYLMNRKVVFKSNSQNTLIKYYSLSVVQMLTSALLVYAGYQLIGSGEVAIKIVVDSILFLISYVIQRDWVFKSKSKSKNYSYNRQVD
ncbi:bifunctional glycosyltransferase family 2/GtrA family protein [Bacillus suaedae]|uniref:Bifunctional glycosyltransferase family 2/GtrA family protein n=1 Tax=Halalkalibacter suaedae TaxID=2822140 RepID=A0A941AMU8_9BACI|nr:bifunctional glycosyltransferase family 2/GtrA family protein [Bacillus suaedae]MBP3950216.1 bifunctional glycosyltransferase family 2/GtrA family protein [Bacillus suaedae]